MDIATEEFSHVEIVGATITMLLGPVNSELKQAFEDSGLKEMVTGGSASCDALISPGADESAILRALRRRAYRYR